MPNRASDRQLSGPDRPEASGSWASAGSRTSSRCSSDVMDARNDSLCVMSRAEKPGVPAGTTKPIMPSFGGAHTIATSATEPLVIHIFEPFRIQSDPSRRGGGRKPAGVEREYSHVRPHTA